MKLVIIIPAFDEEQIGNGNGSGFAFRVGATGLGTGNEIIANSLYIFGTGNKIINYDGRNPSPDKQILAR